MRLKFSGWSRQVLPHDHDVLPIKGGPYSRYPVGKADEALQWDDASSARGRINGLGLSGDFLVELEFKPEELRNWLGAYVKEKPEEAIRLLGEMQAEAILALSSKSQAST